MTTYNATEVDALIKEAVGGLVDSGSSDSMWMLIAGILVFFMHAGFTMLETGSVRHKNAVNILFKNIATISLGSLMYWAIGYGLAYGTDGMCVNDDDCAITKEVNVGWSFIGSGNFALTDENDDNSGKALFFFQTMFAATAATIVSGAVAGRVALGAYMGIAVYLSGFVYPVVSHWVWATFGWLSAFQTGDDAATAEVSSVMFQGGSGGCGAIDFAGSGVVHMTGGMAALVFAAVLGPRIGRFDADGTPVDIAPHNIALQALGTFILWFGWYGFNCGSTLAFNGNGAGSVAVTTTLAPAAAVTTAIIFCKAVYGTFDIGVALNAALAGLVSITAPCSSVDTWMAIVIGAIGFFVYHGASKLMLKIKVDDPVDAIAVHGFAGIWGVLSAGIFYNEETVKAAAYAGCTDATQGTQFATQIVLVLVIIGWVALTCIPMALALKVTGVLRVSEEDENLGLDASEHGGSKVFTGTVSPAVDM